MIMMIVVNQVREREEGREEEGLSSLSGFPISHPWSGYLPSFISHLPWWKFHPHLPSPVPHSPSSILHLPSRYHPSPITHHPSPIPHFSCVCKTFGGLSSLSSFFSHIPWIIPNLLLSHFPIAATAMYFVTLRFSDSPSPSLLSNDSCLCKTFGGLSSLLGIFHHILPLSMSHTPLFHTPNGSCACKTFGGQGLPYVNFPIPPHDGGLGKFLPDLFCCFFHPHRPMSPHYLIISGMASLSVHHQQARWAAPSSSMGKILTKKKNPSVTNLWYSLLPLNHLRKILIFFWN